MKGGRLTRASVAALLLVCLTGLVASAAADDSQKLSIGDVTVNEDAGTATFTISLTAGPDSATVKWATANGSAVANQDYVPQPATAVPVPAEGSTSVSVPLIDDVLDEGNEQFTVNLSEPSGATIDDGSATGTIGDNDPLPTVSIADASASEGATMNFPVTLSAPSGRTVGVHYSTENGSAVAPGDYAARNDEHLSFAPGETSKTATVAIANDAIDENNETLRVRLSDPTNASMGTSLATGTINDTDGPPTINIENAPAVTEGGTASFTVRLTAESTSAVSVKYATENENPVSAAAGSDYTAKNGTLTWAAGDTGSKTITVATLDDTGAAARDEAAETFKVRLSDPSNAAIGSALGTGTINDNDDPPTARIANAPDVNEGGKATFAVTLDGASGRQVRVNYRTADGSAIAGPDFEGKAPGSVITFDPGEPLTKNIEVQTINDTQSEGDETFQVLLTGSPDGSVSIHATQNQATAKIKDNDAQRSLTIVAAEVTEGTGGTANLDFKVRLSGTTSQRVEVTATTADGSAAAPADYQAKTQVLVWASNTPADELEKTFRVVVIGDSLDEIDETMVVRLEGAQNASIAVGQANGTIRDNDHFSTLSISDAEANEGSGGTTSTMTFKVTLSPASARPVHVSYATANGTGTAGSDYTAASGSVSFAPGETSKDVAVAILGDDVNEPNETLQVNLSGAAGAAAADAQGQGTIVDKNAPPSLSIDDPLAREGEGATFTVTLAGTTLQEVRVTFSTGDGTAKEGNDYSARRSTLVFAPGEKTKNVAITVLDDALPEQSETFTVNLADPVNAAITKRTGTATIEASDLSTATPQGGGGTGTPPTNRPIAPLQVPKPSTTKKNVIYPKMVLGPRVVTVVGGRARMLVTCAKASPMRCAGSVALETTTKPMVKLGQKSFTVTKGKKVFVSIVLSTKARKLVQKTGTLKVRAVVFVKTSKATIRVVPGVITIKVAKKTTSSSSTP